MIKIKSYFFALLIFFSALCVNAQIKKVPNLPKFDSRMIHFGFLLGINIPQFTIYKNQGYQYNDSLMSIDSRGVGGFQLGIISEFRPHRFFGLRITPTLTFTERIVEYSFQRQDSISLINKNVESTYFELPMLFKYRSERLNNFAAYMLFGGKFVFDFASKKGVEDRFSKDVLLKLDNRDFGLEFGFGFDFFMPYFKFSPEIKWSFGRRNVLFQDNSRFSSPIDQIRARMIFINFNFEG
jgi:hypothetical protein